MNTNRVRENAVPKTKTPQPSNGATGPDVRRRLNSAEDLAPTSQNRRDNDKRPPLSQIEQERADDEGMTRLDVD